MIKELIINGFKYFEDTVLELHNPEIQAWKDAGKGVIGTTCSNIPEEVLYTGGLLPLRLHAPKIQKIEAFDDFKMDQSPKPAIHSDYLRFY